MRNEICRTCMWFKQEPETPIRPNAPVMIENEIKQTPAQKAARRGGSKPSVYGKCKAVFQNAQNETQVYDFGTLSNSGCTALDDYGYKLFKIG